MVVWIPGESSSGKERGLLFSKWAWHIQEIENQYDGGWWIRGGIEMKTELAR